MAGLLEEENFQLDALRMRGSEFFIPVTLVLRLKGVIRDRSFIQQGIIVANTTTEEELEEEAPATSTLVSPDGVELR